MVLKVFVNYNLEHEQKHIDGFKASQYNLI